MAEKKFHKLGSPLSPSGAVYIAEGKQGALQMHIDLVKTTMELNGTKITPKIEKEIREFCQKEQAEEDKRINSLGIPKKLKILIEMKRKAAVARYCRNLKFSEWELFLLTHNCSQLGFKYRSKFTEFVPSHLKVLDSDINELHKGNSRKFMKKVDGILSERKRLHIHYLEKDNQWHCFYYTYEDIELENNHWKYGPHAHYINYLWPEYKKKNILKSFDKRSVDISGLHIRLIPIKYPESPMRVSMPT
jgi:hypothetical protein